MKLSYSCLENLAGIITGDIARNCKKSEEYLYKGVSYRTADNLYSLFKYFDVQCNGGSRYVMTLDALQQINKQDRIQEIILEIANDEILDLLNKILANNKTSQYKIIHKNGGYSIVNSNNVNNDLIVENEKIEINKANLMKELILWLSYKNNKLLLNDYLLIHTCQLNSINDRLLKFLFNDKNQNRLIDRKELQESGIFKEESERSIGKETKSLFHCLDDINIKENLRKLFVLELSTNAINLRSKITKRNIEESKIEFIDLKELFKINKKQ